jgi:glycosyltransferase involved in cell wall biosynthesis
VIVYDNDENQGISYSRTKGAELASGEIVAFIDDDATAEPDWVQRLAYVYEKTDAIAVGGDVKPDWQTEKPDFSRGFLLACRVCGTGIRGRW